MDKKEATKLQRMINNLDQYQLEDIMKALINRRGLDEVVNEAYNAEDENHRERDMMDGY